MPKFLEDKLKKQYGAKSKTPFKIMNKMGAMKGSKVTAKGLAMEKKHDLGLGSGMPHHASVPKKKKKKSFAEALSGGKY